MAVKDKKKKVGNMMRNSILGKGEYAFFSSGYSYIFTISGEYILVYKVCEGYKL